MYFHNRYALHDTQITNISVANDLIDLEFRNGIYNLDSTNKETDLTKCCHVLIQISDPNIDNCVEIIKIKKSKLHYISLAELREMMTHSVFEVELDFYSNFNNAFMLIGYIACHKIVFTVHESIDFRISFLE